MHRPYEAWFMLQQSNATQWQVLRWSAKCSGWESIFLNNVYSHFWTQPACKVSISTVRSVEEHGWICVWSENSPECPVLSSVIIRKFNLEYPRTHVNCTHLSLGAICAKVYDKNTNPTVILLAVIKWHMQWPTGNCAAAWLLFQPVSLNTLKYYMIVLSSWR